MRVKHSHLPVTVPYKRKVEHSKNKRDRKKDFLENKNNAFKVVLPIMGIITIIICLLVYSFTRPKH